MRRTVRSLRAALALMVVTTVVGGPMMADAATTVVSPSAMGVWEKANQNTAGGAAVANGVFVDGPAAAPAGDGSFRQVAATGHKQYLHTREYAGEPISALSLSFSTHTTDPGPTVLTSALKLEVDTDGDQVGNRTLVFEPYEQVAPFPATATGVWQTWANAETGRWWATGAPYTVSGPRKTLTDWNTELGGDVVLATLTTFGSLRFEVGDSGTWPDMETHVDRVLVGTDEYDFEQDPITTVLPGSLANWEPTVTGDPATAAAFVLGPDAPPQGVGSFRQRIATPDDFAGIQNNTFAGTPLAGLDLRFWTYVSANSGAQAPTLKLRVDNDGNGTGDTTMIFEPYQQTGVPAGTPNQCSSPCPQIGVWQEWDATHGGWWTNPPGGGGPPTTTLFQYAKANPRAQIALSNGSVRIESGSSGPSWVGTDANVDFVTVNGKRYDFEPISGALDCDTTTADIAAVQNLVDSAPDGFVLKLRGTCDFSAAPAHGGDQTSIQNTAVLIRPSNPFAAGLTIESDGAPQSATILGGGTQTAFTIAPGNDNVTIRGLRFVNFARPIVTINNSGTTIGDPTGVPSAAGNRIIGGSTMREAILGLSISTNPYPGTIGEITINYGAGGSASATYTGQGAGELTDLDVLGNYISYDPPGTEDGTNQVIGIAVRQRFANEVEDVLIKHNAVGMFASEFPTSNMAGVMLHSFNSVPTTGPGDYLIRDVEIDGNNLGRLEELGLGADVHATGRTGIVLIGVSDFAITDNGVRTRVSPTGIPMPGGGIIVSDSGFGRVGPGNSSIVLTDPSVTDADMGAYAVLEDYASAFASAPKAQSTTAVELRGNRIGAVGGPGIFARRGLVVTKASAVVAHDNDFEHTSEDAVNLGVNVAGPGSITSPGPVTLPTGVSDSIVCQNNLDGTTDDVDEVTTGAVISNAFPGGATVPTDNAACDPTLALAPGTLTATSGDLEAAGTAWPNRPVSVELTSAGAPAGPIVKAGTAGADGTFQIDFTPAEWSSLGDGVLTAVATASDAPTGLSADSAPDDVLKDTDLPATPVIVSPPDGSIVPPAFTVSGTGPAGQDLRLEDAGVEIATTSIPGSGNWSIDLTGQAGALVLNAYAVDGVGNDSLASNTVNLNVDASVPAAPVIDTPLEAEIVLSNTVTISGSATPGHTVELRKAFPAPNALLGTFTAAPVTGDWSVTTTMADGIYQVRAIAKNGVGTPSAPAIRNFRVKTDFTAPLAPVITNPANGSLHPAQVNVRGQAEVGSQVQLKEGGGTIGQAITGPDGTFSMQLVFKSGSHTIRAVATDAGGNVSPESAPVTFTVDATAPGVTITTGNLTPFFGQPEIRGTASDNVGVSRVEIRVADALGNEVSRTDATLLNPRGLVSVWTVEPETGTGPFTIRATSYDLAGNRSGTRQIQIVVIAG